MRIVFAGASEPASTLEALILPHEGRWRYYHPPAKGNSVAQSHRPLRSVRDELISKPRL